MTQDSGVIARPARTVELDFGKFHKLAEAHDWLLTDGYDYDRIAYELAISTRHARRVLGRESRPGGTFIGGLLTAAEEAGFRRVFRLVDLDAPIGKD